MTLAIRNNMREKYKKQLESGVCRIGRWCRKCQGDVRYSTTKRCIECKHNLDADLYLKRKTLKQVEERHNITL